MSTHQFSAEAWIRAAAIRHGGNAVVLGKGPSSREFDSSAYPGYLVIGLNEVGLQTKVHAAFVIDEDILLRSGPELIDAVGEALIIPRVMHRVRSRIGGVTWYGPYEDASRDTPWRQAHPQKQYSYNFASAHEADASLGAVYAGFSFSAPTLVNLLARNGFARIVLAGIDGGTSYAPSYAEYEYKKLRSVQDNFDIQFRELRQIRAECGVSIRSVRCDSATVLIGAQPEQALAEEVLRWSIESNTFLDIRFVAGESSSKDAFSHGKAGTPFSFQRLYLPELSGHKGRGLYFDSDMLVFRDVYEVFNADMGDNVLLSCASTKGRPHQHSVFLVDNKRATWVANELVRDYESGRRSYESLLRDFSFAQPQAIALPSAWNSLESYTPDVTANIHYTDMHNQPWLSTANPLASLWCEALFKSLDTCERVRQAFASSLNAGWIRPSLRWQADKLEPDPWRLPAAIRKLDDRWTPPHLVLQRAALPSRLHLMRWELARAVRRWGASPSVRRMRYLGKLARKAVSNR